VFSFIEEGEKKQADLFSVAWSLASAQSAEFEDFADVIGAAEAYV
jgi:hypothetical protein